MVITGRGRKRTRRNLADRLSGELPGENRFKLAQAHISSRLPGANPEMMVDGIRVLVQ